MNFRTWLCIIPIILLTFGCGNKRDKTVEKPSNLNVIIISVDTLRPDHMSAYGYERKTTPNLDEFFKTAAVFTDAVTPYPKTAASLASMLTGLYPHRHGVRRNAKDRLSRNIATMPEILKKHDYATAAFVSNVILKSKLSGFNRGFDVYDETLKDKELNRKIFERKAPDIFEASASWIENNKDKKFFLWVHFIDPHGPYTAPPPYDTLFKSEEKKEIPIGLIPKYQRHEGLNDANQFIDYYDGEIRFMDHYAGKLLNIINDAGLRGKSIIIFVADHGESLGEHNDYFEHGRRVYDTCLRIPLAISFPPAIPEGRTINSPVLINDILPTLLDLLNIESPADIDGKSLLPLIKGETGGLREYSFSEALNQYKPPTVPDYISGFKSVRTKDWKMIFSIDKKGKIAKEEFYNISKDHKEEKNISGSGTDIEAKMRAELKNWIDSQETGILTDILNLFKKGSRKIKTKNRLDKNDIEALKSLGYVQ